MLRVEEELTRSAAGETLETVKLLIAYVRTSKRIAVEQALRGAGLKGWSESVVEGHGRAAQGHGVDHIRIEVAVEDEQSEAIRLAITKAAQSEGEIGDGMVLGLSLDFVTHI